MIEFKMQQMRDFFKGQIVLFERLGSTGIVSALREELSKLYHPDEWARYCADERAARDKNEDRHR